MGNNDWVIPVFSAAGALLLYLGYKMYENNENNTNAVNADARQEQEVSDRIQSGGKSKRRKHRKNASKRRR